MRVALISPYSDIFSPGVRSISAYLRANGVETRLICFPNLYVQRVLQEFLEPYSPELLDGVARLCQDVDLVAISLMTNLFERAIQLTSYLKEHLSVPIVWGGIHPTIRPEECIEHADLVVMGEGEGAILELAVRVANGYPVDGLENICSRNSNGIRKNPVRPLIQELDSIPPPDFDNPDYHVFDPESRKFVVPDLKMMMRLHGKGPLHTKGELNYQTITTRGCPFNCAYCGNSALIKLYGRKGYLRRRSVDNIISELVTVKGQMDFINRVCFFDDSFLAGSTKEIEEFAGKYKAKIGLPLFCLSSPSNITPEKLDPLVDAGLTAIQVGIQTGSDRINSIYNRTVKNEAVLKAAKLINHYGDRLLPLYDVIVDNPYESPSDGLETVKLLMQLKKPFTVQVFSLTLFPGTELYDRASKDGLIKDETKEIYDKFYMEREGKYSTLLMALVNRGAPKSLMKFLTSKYVARLLSSSWLGPIYKLLYIINEKLSIARDRIAHRSG
ncbi:MAG: B12-binding domain-containing radical SAM protein [Candidatus Coatesbacteria bacterium]|nr:B12-binding domain-containing radical SAM protein [Candidatus Coatesbacteria bacterium]